MSWLDRELERQIGILVSDVQFNRTLSETVAAQVIRAAYRGGLGDVARTRIRDASEPYPSGSWAICNGGWTCTICHTTYKVKTRAEAMSRHG